MNKKYPWMKKDLKFIEEMGKGVPGRVTKFKKQYEAHGWCEAECWNLDHQFAKWIVPRLELFIKHYAGIPGEFTKNEWFSILNKMLIGFKYMASEEYWNFDKEKNEQVNEALELFGKYARCLWN